MKKGISILYGMTLESSKAMDEELLFDVAESRPENLLLAGTNDLLEFAKDNSASPDLRRTVLAELVVRWCLTGNNGVEGELASLLIPTWRPFADWYRMLRPWVGQRSLPEKSDAWPEPAGFPGFVAALRRRLARLFAADGFIPLCRDEEAWFVPFQLVTDVDGAVWSDGREIAVWRDPVCKALAGTESTGIRLQLRNGPELASGVRGSSLMLPVRMAAMRGKERGLPEYDVLQVLATGAFDSEFRLEDVALRQKYNAMKSQGLDAFLIGPDVPGVIPEEERAFLGLDLGLDEQGVFSAIRNRLERTPGSVRMSRDYVLHRLPDMMKCVDRENHCRWNEVAVQLEQLKEAVLKRRNPEEWLEFSSLLATALCHAGRPETSKKCIREALAFAREHEHEHDGFTAKALRLQITAAVIAQDEGDIDEYRVLADGLASDLKDFTGPERNDLLMRYHGTAAQAHAFGVVFGIKGFSRVDALEHVKKAIEAAESIAAAVSPEDKDEAESNVVQDLNYRHLLCALFSPGTPDECQAFAETQSQLSNIVSGRSVLTNRHFQMRQKSLAYFNAWRNGTDVPPASARDDVRLPSRDAADWQVAANRRHLGALAAAVDDVDEAVSCFEEGEKALPFDPSLSPVLASIRFVLLVQAACSLAACGQRDESAKYAGLVEETYSAFWRSKLFGVIRADKWMAALCDKADPRALPAFYY